MGCKRSIKDSWWNWCGETDMGQTLPVLCKGCGGKYDLVSDEELEQIKIKQIKTKQDKEKWIKENPEDHKRHLSEIAKLIKQYPLHRNRLGVSKITYSVRGIK